MSNGEAINELMCGKSIEGKKLGLARSFPQKSSFKTRNPTKELRKTVSFNDVPDFNYLPSTENGIFWINQMKFHEKIQHKSDVFSKSSKKKDFINVLANVLKKHFKIIATIYMFVVKFDGYDIILSQTKIPFSTDKMFPSAETIAKLEKTKGNFKEKLIKLFNLIEPASEVNEDLSNMIDMVDANTKITQHQLDQLNEESQKVDNIFQHFEIALKEFTIETYKKHLSNIRVAVNKFEDKVINQFEASFSSQADLIELNNLCPKMEKSLDTVMEINFTELNETMKKVHSLAKTVLNINDTCEWPNKAKKSKKTNWFFRIPIFVR